jgi:hypothetical protein
LQNTMTGKSTSYFRNTPTLTKIYVDGFHIDTITAPGVGDAVETAALTPKVRVALEEEGKTVKQIIPIPQTNPKFIIIYTEF